MNPAPEVKTRESLVMAGPTSDGPREQGSGIKSLHLVVGF